MIALTIIFSFKNTLNEIRQTMNYYSSLIGSSIYYTIEYNQNGRPHIHGITEAKQSLTEAKLKTYCGYNWQIKPIFYDMGWLDYITKERKEIYQTHSNEIQMITNGQNTRPKQSIECKTIKLQPRRRQ